MDLTIDILSHHKENMLSSIELKKGDVLINLDRGWAPTMISRDLGTSKLEDQL